MKCCCIPYFYMPHVSSLIGLFASCLILALVAAYPQSAAGTPAHQQRLRGLREVVRAIESMPGAPNPAHGALLGQGASNGVESVLLSTGVPNDAKIVLIKTAREVLEQYGPLSLAKRSVVYRQTRRCLLTPMAQFPEGGVEGYKLWGLVFKWEFTNYVRLPDVSAVQRKAAMATFRRVGRAERMLIHRTYSGTPPPLRKKLAAMVSVALASLARNWPDYYDISLLYPPARVPTTKALYLRLRRDGEVAADGQAFSSIKALLGGHHPLGRKTVISLESFFLGRETFSQVSNVNAVLTGYFSGWSQRAGRVYRNMPKSLENRLHEFHVKMVALGQRGWLEETDPAFNSRLYPTGSEILKGSGVCGH